MYPQKHLQPAAGVVKDTAHKNANQRGGWKRGGSDLEDWVDVSRVTVPDMFVTCTNRFQASVHGSTGI